MRSLVNTNPGVWYAIATAVGLGAITTQAKLVYADGGNALTVMLARFLFSVVVIGSILMFRERGFHLHRTIRIPTLWLGLVWCGSMIVYLLSVQTITVSIAALLLYTYPVIVLLVSVLTGQVRATAVLVALFVVAFTGIGLALSGGELVLDPRGIIFAFLAGCGAAYTFLRGARLAPTCDPVALTFWINLVGLVIIIPIVSTRFSLPSSATGLVLLGSATICYIVAILCQFQALARLPATTAAFVLNLEPVVSILLAVLVLSEWLTVMQWLGVALVLGTLFHSSRVFSEQQNK